MPTLSKLRYPYVLFFGMNFMNFMNFAFKSSTYNVNNAKQNVNFMNFAFKSSTYAVMTMPN